MRYRINLTSKEDSIEFDTEKIPEISIECKDGTLYASIEPYDFNKYAAHITFSPNKTGEIISIVSLIEDEDDDNKFNLFVWDDLSTTEPNTEIPFSVLDMI